MAQQSLSFTERAILAYIRTVSGTLSVVSSGLLIRKILYQKNRGNASATYQRMIFGMSVLDILTSSWMALSTLPVPRATGAVGALGNTATCSTQGFFVELSVGAPIYMASLSAFFMLKIRYNMSDTVISKKYEPAMHIVPWFAALVLASTGAALELYNALPLPELGCWVHGYPANCGFVPGLECTRGYKIEKNLSLYCFMFSYGWLVLAFGIVVICHVLIYTGIRRQERRNAVFYDVPVPSILDAFDSQRFEPNRQFESMTPSRLMADGSDEVAGASGTSGISSDENKDSLTMDTSGGPQSSVSGQVKEPRKKRTGKRRSVTILGGPRSTEKSRAAAMQSLLFVTFAFCTAICPFMVYLRYRLQWSVRWRVTFAFMMNALYPLQGFFNLMVYIRPRYLLIRKQYPERGRIKTLLSCIFSLDA